MPEATRINVQSDLPVELNDHALHPVSYDDAKVNQVYLTYILLGGHLQRVAVACEVDEDWLRHKAAQEGWDKRMDTIARLTTDNVGRPAVERMLNRACSYVQVMRIRRLCDAVLNAVEDRLRDDDDALEMFTVTDKNGNSRLDFSPMHELAATALKCNEMAFKALCDTGPERGRRATIFGKAEDHEKVLEITSRVAAALSKLDQPAPSHKTDAVADTPKDIEGGNTDKDFSEPQ